MPEVQNRIFIHVQLWLGLAIDAYLQTLQEQMGDDWNYGDFFVEIRNDAFAFDWSTFKTLGLDKPLNIMIFPVNDAFDWSAGSQYYEIAVNLPFAIIGTRPEITEVNGIAKLLMDFFTMYDHRKLYVGTRENDPVKENGAFFTKFVELYQSRSIGAEMPAIKEFYNSILETFYKIRIESIEVPDRAVEIAYWVKQGTIRGEGIIRTYNEAELTTTRDMLNAIG